MTPRTSWTWLLAVALLAAPLFLTEGVEGWGSVSPVPSESECRPYIEKALKEQLPTETSQEAVDVTSSEAEASTTQSADQEGSIEETEEATTKDSTENQTSDETKIEDAGESLGTAESLESSNENEEPGQSTGESEEIKSQEDVTEEKVVSNESQEAQEQTTSDSVEEVKTEESVETSEPTNEEQSAQSVEGGESAEVAENVEVASTEATSTETQEDATTTEEQSAENVEGTTNEEKSTEEGAQSGETTEDIQNQSLEQELEQKASEEVTEESKPEEASQEVSAGEETSETKAEETQEVSDNIPIETVEASEETKASTEDQTIEESAEIAGGEVTDSVEVTDPLEISKDSKETEEKIEASPVDEAKESVEETKETVESSTEASAEKSTPESTEDPTQSGEDVKSSGEEQKSDQVSEESVKEAEAVVEGAPESVEQSTEQKEAEVVSETTEAVSAEGQASAEAETAASQEASATEQEVSAEAEPVKEPEPTVEDQLTLEFEAPKVRRSREHIAEILKLNPESAETELLLAKTIEGTLKELKRLYDAAIKPLEILYKYRDLSNRHFGDPEIFSKPLILFMGPWSGGKSSILNYLMDNEFKTSSLRTGAEPSPAYFNILMWGEREEVLDGTQLAADWTFSGLQKFGQGLLDRLRGLRLNNPLLEKVNIVEIPGILEIRKQVERLFPFNDACQWFIDRADIIFLVYDPSKLDVGPETEAILDQLKGREYQTRIILNKADQVKPEELMRVQGTLIWNISPLMSSMEPPVMYSTSLWSIPYEQGAPSRLLHAQERAFLRDLRLAIDKRAENKIASARRFAVRVRNHAKMVDCYLTTYYNHKTFFGNRKKVADEIIEHPQNYHIYEGLSTLTNISRYDLPDPEVYRDFFRLNPLFDFQRLSETCTFFRGCPINRLDVAIAYDLPELVGKYKKQAEKVLDQIAGKQSKS